MNWKEERVAKRKEQVARVKALGLKPGDWVTSSGGRGVWPCLASDLNARSACFRNLYRASPEQIAKREQEIADRERRRVEAEALRSRPDYQLAARFSSTERDAWLRLPLAELEAIAEILDRVKA